MTTAVPFSSFCTGKGGWEQSSYHPLNPGCLMVIYMTKEGHGSPIISSFPLQNVKPLYSILSDGSCCSILKEEAHQCLSHIK